MFGRCSSYCENFIYISLSIVMWHGIFENWWITKMPFQLKHYTRKQGIEFIIFSREKHISWTIFALNHRLNSKKVEKSSSCLKWVKNSLERVKLCKRVKLPNYPLQRQSHPFEQMERSALSLKKEYNIFWCCKKSKFIILLIFVPISRIVVTL